MFPPIEPDLPPRRHVEPPRIIIVPDPPRSRFRRYFPVALVGLWMVVIFMASTGLGRPENSARILDPILQFFNVKNVGAVQIVFRKLGHVTEYSIFALLLSYLLLSRRALRQWWFAIALACIFLYACSDEFHQIFVPERHASMHDVMIDTTSGFVVLSLVAGLRRLFRQREI